jgi:endonuclease-3
MDKFLEAIALLRKNYPGAKYYLNFSNPLELTVAAIMSAQVRDEAVNNATPEIFRKYKNAKDYASTNPSELAKYMKSITFAAAKAKNIVNACKILVDKYNGNIPESMDDLISLPGIGRKTANTILINAFGKVEGIPTDTHVIRVSYRLGWTKSKKPDEIENDLMKIIPKGEWKSIAYILKAHGRAVCKAPLPYCSRCFLTKLCPKQGVTDSL